MAPAIVLATLKRLAGIGRATAVVASIVAMLILPVLHATGAPLSDQTPTQAFASGGSGSHHAGHAQSAHVSHDAEKARGTGCLDMAGCPVHAQLAGATVDLGDGVFIHAIADGVAPDLHPFSRSADSPPPRFQA
jgi:hypothetical protein